MIIYQVNKFGELTKDLVRIYSFIEIDGIGFNLRIS